MTLLFVSIDMYGCLCVVSSMSHLCCVLYSVYATCVVALSCDNPDDLGKLGFETWIVSVVAVWFNLDTNPGTTLVA